VKRFSRRDATTQSSRKVNRKNFTCHSTENESSLFHTTECWIRSGQTQVLPYLKQLAEAGVDFTLLSFERTVAYTDEGRERCGRLH
jgi:hypothetical protein